MSALKTTHEREREKKIMKCICEFNTKKMHFSISSKLFFFLLRFPDWLKNANRWKSYEKLARETGIKSASRCFVRCLSNFSLLTRCDNWQMMNFSWWIFGEFMNLCLRFSNKLFLVEQMIEKLVSNVFGKTFFKTIFFICWNLKSYFFQWFM